MDYLGQLNCEQGGDFCMPAQWTGDLIGKMHLTGITAKELAAQVGWHPKYLSAVLNGHRESKNAEQALTQALDQLIAKRGEEGR